MGCAAVLPHAGTHELGKSDFGASEGYATEEEKASWISCCAAIVTHSYFDIVISTFIILNGLSIGVQTNYMATELVMEVPLALRGIEVFFCCIFTLELVIRIGAFGAYFAKGPEKWWNFFDTAVVTLQIVEEIVNLYTALQETSPDEDSSTLSQNFSFMRILRVLRLIRIVRLVRVLRLISELRTIVTSIASSLRHLLWTVLLLVLMIYTIATYLTQLVADTRLANPATDDSDLIQWWGSVGRSCLTLFEAISGGCDWDSNVVPLMQINVLLGPCFCWYIAFAILALMNVVTGVFVENAIDSANKDKEKYLVQTAQELFARADPNGTGVITWAEFQRQLQCPELQGYFQGLGVDPKSAKGLFRILDLDNSGEIDSQELLTGTLRLRGAAKAIDLAALIYENRRMARRLQVFQRSVLRCLTKVDKRMDDKVDDMRRSFIGDTDGPLQTSRSYLGGSLLGSSASACSAKTGYGFDDFKSEEPSRHVERLMSPISPLPPIHPHPSMHTENLVSAPGGMQVVLKRHATDGCGDVNWEEIQDLR